MHVKREGVAPDARKHETKWAFLIAPDGDNWVIKLMEAHPDLTRGGHSVPNLDEALGQIRMLAGLLAEDELTKNISRSRPRSL